MFDQVECPNPAYRKIIEAGLDGLIRKRREKVEHFVSIDELPDNFDKILSDAEKVLMSSGKISQKREAAKDILYFAGAIDGDYDRSDKQDEEIFEFERARSLSLKHPSLLAYLAIGREVFRFRELGFPTRRSLEESLASFCIAERDSLFHSYEPSRIWRNGRYKNEVIRNVHGDLFVRQTDVSGRYFKENTLFGEEEVFDSILRDPPSAGFGAYQDWSGFLLSLLRYAEALGKEKMPEIVNWREIMEKEGGHGGNWADGHCDFGLEWKMQMKLLREGEEMRGNTPIFIPNGYSEHRIETIPYFSKEGKLVYKTSKGEKIAEYDKTDMKEALIANYCYFARDRVLMYKIMEGFIKKTDYTGIY